MPRRIAFAGRQWELRVSAVSASLPGTQRWSLWFFSVVGLVAVAMLSALLLTITGRARRVEQAVAERTADLIREVEERQRTEAALRESEERIRNILDHVPLGIIYADVEGEFAKRTLSCGSSWGLTPLNCTPVPWAPWLIPRTARRWTP
ncbi:hypothetical protein [Ideonella paludis]|uniref:hypothetical protein n=1 Tax=Ideonella paludis TaxID=1233411 RepID=UPI003643DB4A